MPFITAAQVKDYRVDYVGAPKLSGEPLNRLRVGFSEVGDAILTHKGTVGRAAKNTQKCVLTPRTIYYRCNGDVINPQWLVYFFASFPFYYQLAAVMAQTSRFPNNTKSSAAAKSAIALSHLSSSGHI